MMSNLDRALRILNAIDMVEDGSDEKALFDAIYEELESIDIEEFDASELDEEEELELTPAYDIESEFNDFSVPYASNVGTSLGQNRVEKVADGYDVHFNGLVIPVMLEDSAKGLLKELETGSEHIDNYCHYPEPVSKPFNTGKTLDEAFGPCGAD